MSGQSDTFLADASVFVLMLYADLPGETQSLSTDGLSLSFAAFFGREASGCILIYFWCLS